MKYRLMTATALIAFSAEVAMAADVAPHPYVKAPLAATYDWSGFYLGVAAGGGLANTTIDDKVCSLSCSSQNLTSAFATVGGTAGYNYQFGPGLFGIEADVNWTNSKSTLIDPEWFLGDQLGSVHSAKSDWFVTVRGRFGLAVDRVLVYGTGGVAFVDRKVSGNSTNGTCQFQCFAINETAVGIVGGVGVEYALSGMWSAKIEYLHVATPTKRAFDLNPNERQTFNQYAATTSVDIVRAGINYKFGGTDTGRH